jgi:hypothetical protein
MHFSTVVALVGLVGTIVGFIGAVISARAARDSGEELEIRLGRAGFQVSVKVDHDQLADELEEITAERVEMTQAHGMQNPGTVQEDELDKPLTDATMRDLEELYRREAKRGRWPSFWLNFAQSFLFFALGVVVTLLAS